MKDLESMPEEEAKALLIATANQAKENAEKKCRRCWNKNHRTFVCPKKDEKLSCPALSPYGCLNV